MHSRRKDVAQYPTQSPNFLILSFPPSESLASLICMRVINLSPSFLYLTVELTFCSVNPTHSMYSKEVIEMITQGFKKTFPAISYQNVMDLAEYIEFVEVPKKTEIIKSGQYYGKIVFVISGLFRAYYKYQETENTFWFREE